MEINLDFRRQYAFVGPLNATRRLCGDIYVAKSWTPTLLIKCTTKIYAK